MEILDHPDTHLDITEELHKLVRRHQAAQNAGITLLNRVGGSVESIIDRAPEPLQNAFNRAVEHALGYAVSGAQKTRGFLPDNSPLTRTMTTAFGALGGMGGLATALVELPVTTVFLLRTVQDEALENGFDPQEPGVQFDCVQVLATAGPMQADDGSDFAFLSTRLALTSRTVQSLIRRVAPHLAAVLGQKLAAQSVPLIGAVAGASTNYLYMTYYRDMAYIHFRLRRLAIDTDIPLEDLIAKFCSMVAASLISDRD